MSEPASTSLEIDIRIELPASAFSPDLDRLKTLVEAIGQQCNLADATINIRITDDTHIRQVKHQYFGIDEVTDCISFDSSSTARKIFEIMVNGELAVRQADDRQIEPEAELALYITHGLLHQLGFDDCTAEKAETMHRMEDNILNDLGYGTVYHTCDKRMEGNAT